MTNKVQFTLKTDKILYVPEKTEPWNKGILRPSSGVYDCSHTFIVKYDHYAFEWYIVEIPPVMHHWAALFSKLNVKIQFHFIYGRQITYNNRIKIGL